MSIEASSLLSPSPQSLPLLFEVGRLLDRHADPGDALGPIVRSVGETGTLFEGAAALVTGFEGPGTGGASPLILRVPSTLAPFAMGSRVGMGEGVLGRVLEAGHSLSGRDEEGPWVAAPTLLGGSVRGILAFRRAEEAAEVDALALVEALVALLGEALLLRRLIAAKMGSGSEGLREPGRDSLRETTREGRVFGPGAPYRSGEEFEQPELAVIRGGLLGRSAAMVEVRHLIERVGPTESTVLVTGESGTGKELAARALHEASPRASGPFIAVNCAALPESLIESELFGHERGSFTGAEARRRGRFELAAGGTLFFDEVGELGAGVQAKLLRVIQERVFERVGGGEAIRADVRLIAATNRDLEGEVAAGRFREDLFWRLNVFPLRMPPLRERGGDIVLLADRFAETLGARLGKPVLRISTPALDLFTSYHWPGNVRELENAIERAVVLSTDGVIHAWHLPPSLQSAASTGTGPHSTLDSSLARIERELIVEALKMNAGRASGAARQLGITERRIGLAIHRYGIDWRRFRTKR